MKQGNGRFGAPPLQREGISNCEGEDDEFDIEYESNNKFLDGNITQSFEFLSLVVMQ